MSCDTHSGRCLLPLLQCALLFPGLHHVAIPLDEIPAIKPSEIDPDSSKGQVDLDFTYV